MICDMSIPESFLCQFLDLSQSLIFIAVGIDPKLPFLVQLELIPESFFSSWTYPYVLVLLVLGLVPESNFREFWDLMLLKVLNNRTRITYFQVFCGCWMISQMHYGLDSKLSSVDVSSYSHSSIKD